MGNNITISLSIESIRKACGKPNEKLTREDINKAIVEQSSKGIFLLPYKLTDSAEKSLLYYFMYGTEFQSLELEMDMEKLQSCSSFIPYISPRDREAMLHFDSSASFMRKDVTYIYPGKRRGERIHKSEGNHTLNDTKSQEPKADARRLEFPGIITKEIGAGFEAATVPFTLQPNRLYVDINNISAEGAKEVEKKVDKIEKEATKEQGAFRS